MKLLPGLLIKPITRWTIGYVIYFCGHGVNYLSLNVKYFVVRDRIQFFVVKRPR